MRIEIDFKKLAFKAIDITKTFAMNLKSQLLALKDQVMNLQLPWLGRRVILSKYLIVVETLLAIFCFPFTFFFLYGTGITGLEVQPFWLAFALYTLCVLGLEGLQVYLRGMWTFNAHPSSLRILSFSSALIFIFAPLYFLVAQDPAFSGSALILNWVLLNLLLSAAHFAFEFLEFHFKPIQISAKKSLTRVILVGSEPYLSTYLESLLDRHDHRFEVLGVMGTKSIPGETLMDVPVLGGVQEATRIFKRLHGQEKFPERLVVIDPYFRGDDLRKLWNITEAEEVEIRIAEDDDETELPHLRQLTIEDFIKRISLKSHEAALTPFFANKRILITGAGGTLGQALAKKLLKCKPHDLILVDHDENRLNAITEELSHQDLYVRIHPYLMSIRSKSTLESIFAHHKPEIVLHAAGLKHIPLVEENPASAFETNLLGFRNLADVARTHQVRSFVTLSTLGAHHPQNLLDALKHLEETYTLALDAVERHKPQGTQFIPIRFGNIAMSHGSVLEKIQHQIDNLRPITLTHPEAERSFHCLEDLVNLILESLLYHGHYQGASRIYIVEPDAPQRIQSLAEDMVRLRGLKPHHDISMKLSGLRSGDRLQDLPFPHSKFTATEVPHLWHKTPKSVDLGFISRAITEIEGMLAKSDLNKAISVLTALVPEYKKEKD